MADDKTLADKAMAGTTAQSTMKKNLLMYPLGTVGRDMTYCLVSNFLLTYILFTRSLTNAQLAAVTGIMIFARIFDALNDPIMGNIIESTRTKWGKFKPWLLAGMITTSFVVYFAFSTNLTGWGFIVFFGFIYIMYSITYTMSDISYWGMVPALSSDANARNQFTSRATLFAGIGGTAASILIPVLTTGAGAIGGSAKTAFSVIALAIGIIAPIFAAFTIFGVRENRDDQTKPAEKVSFKKIIKTITGNDQLLWVSLVFLIQQVGNSIVIGGIGATYMYFEFGYNGAFYSMFTTVGMAATAFLMVFYPAISRHLTRKRFMGILMIVSTVGYALMLGSGLFLPTGNLKYWIIVIGYMFGNFGNYGYYLTLMISIMNTVEYNEYKFGAREEGIIASLRPFLTKMASAIMVGLTSLTYVLMRVTHFTNQISAFENDASVGAITEAEKLASISGVLGGVQSWQTAGLLVVMALLSEVCMLVAFVLYKKFYKLDEPEYERICKELGRV